MHRHSVIVAFALSLALVAAAPAPPAAHPGSPIERVIPNDNRQPAGQMRDGALVLRLEARVAMWHPDGDSGPGAPTPAFAEAGGPARIPGPLIRVRAGTTVDVRITNTLADTLVVHGLYARPGEAQSRLTIAPGEARDARFRLGAPGTYYYWGTTTRRAMDFRTLADAQLTGAIVVDDSTAPARDDRVLVLGMWTDTVHRARTRRERVLGVINGRSWPHTERFRHTVGDTVRWRVINASADGHPMHLHGFYFRLTRRGDEQRDTAANDLAVTELLSSGLTMEMMWIPERPGNWLFHCHIPEHFSPRASLGLSRHGHAASAGDVDHARDGMNGLVMGVHVQAGQAVAAAQGAPRQIRLLVRPRPGSSQERPRYSYALHEGGPEPALESREGAPTLDLTRGDPVRITIVNRLPDPTAVHWHGIELESYYDGVPGFSGIGKSITPLIAPGDSFQVRFTPPRAGTFIYHTHADEERQQMAGLAGAIVVSEPGQPRDHRRDIPIVLGQRTTPGAPAFGVDGYADLTALELTAGVPYRLRFVQIDANYSVLRVELRRDSAYASWRPLAKDGADLPDDRRVMSVSRARLGIGETFDVEVTPDTIGAYRLQLAMGLRYPLAAPLLTTLPVRVRRTDVGYPVFRNP
jgi:FtsP/CotA-like multicopper oxidase with cupredoxin domain